MSFWNLREHYDHSEFLDLQRGFKLFLGGSVWQGCSGDAPGLKVVVDLTSCWICDMVTYSDSKAVRSNRVPRGIAPGPYTSSRGSLLGSSKPRGVNLGGGSGHLLTTRTCSSGDAVPSGLDACGGLGTGMW